jgi:hypothetical protein
VCSDILSAACATLVGLGYWRILPLDMARVINRRILEVRCWRKTDLPTALLVVRLAR